jgi:O-antigen ligase
MQNSIRSTAIFQLGRNLVAVLVLGAVSAGTAVILTSTGSSMIWDGVRVLGIATLLGFSLAGAFRSPGHHPRAVFAIWLLLLTSQRIFFREDIYANEAAFEGNFPATAYAEAICWVLCFVAVVILFATAADSWRRLFTGEYRWLTFFALICLLSCAYAPRPLFGVAWVFKLALVILLLLLCSLQIRDVQDIASFLRFTFWAFAIIVLVPILLGSITGSAFDAEGRLGSLVNPDGLSGDAGTLMLLAPLSYSRSQGAGVRLTTMILGGAGFVVMIIAGGKAAIVAGILAGGLFFLVRRGVGAALGYFAAASMLAFVLAVFTPLSGYLQHYGQSDQGMATLSGRTLLWNAVLPAIWRAPILGHGYLASTFVAMQVNAVEWGAPHLHNAFLEVLYNNGLVGLALIIIINYVILRNLLRVLRRIPATDFIHQIAAGCLALYASFLLNGFFNASFGGRARPPFMALLALVIVGEKLAEFAAQGCGGEPARTPGHAQLIPQLMPGALRSPGGV